MSSYYFVHFQGGSNHLSATLPVQTSTTGWQAGVLRADIPRRWIDVQDYELTLYYPSGNQKQLPLTKGHFGTLERYCAYINDTLEDAGCKAFKFYDRKHDLTTHVRIEDTAYRLVLPTKLKDQLGLPNEIVESYTVHGTGTSDIGKQLLRIHGDFVFGSTYNDSYAPIMATIPLTYDTVSFHANTVQYFPVTKQYMDKLNLFLYDEDYRPLDFLPNCSINVAMHLTN